LPVVFPIVGLFLVALFLFNVISFAANGVLMEPIPAGTAIELFLYAALWLFVCDCRRWAAMAFMALTAANLLLYFLTKEDSFWHQISDALLLFDALLCFFLLFYFRRFR